MNEKDEYATYLAIRIFHHLGKYGSGNIVGVVSVHFD